MSTDLVTIKEVPLLRVGTFDASTGEFSADTAMLEAIVRAWESGYTNDPVLKLGHQGHRVHDDSGRAYGQVTNLRLADGGTVLLGDYVNVPRDIAESLPSAYPYRSVELALNVTRRDERGDVVDTYDAVLTALALLGDTEPAVAGLGVTPAVAASRLADGMSVESTAVVLASLPGGRSVNYLRDALARALGAPVLDFTDTDVFVSDPASDTGVSGRRYTVHETTGEIVLDGDPYPVEAGALYGAEDAPALPGAVEVPAAGVAAADVPHSPGDGPDDESINHEEETVMENLASLLTEEQRTALAVDDNTPDDEVWAALVEYAFTAPAPEADAAAAELAAGESRVSTTVLAAMQSRIAELEAAEQARIEEERAARVEAALGTAVREGRIGDDELDAWRSAYEANEESASALLSLRAPMFNTTEQGFATASAHMKPEDVNEAFDRFMSDSLKINAPQEG